MMRTNRNGFTTALALSFIAGLILLAPEPSLAQEKAQMAKEGDLSGTHSFSGTFKATKIGDDLLLVTSENLGLIVSDSGAGPFNDLSGRCVSQVLYVKGVGRNQGHCVYMDRAGDQWLLEFEAPAQKLGAATQRGTVKYLGGTGKFAGVRGEGEYAYTNLRPVADGTGWRNATLADCLPSGGPKGLVDVTEAAGYGWRFFRDTARSGARRAVLPVFAGPAAALRAVGRSPSLCLPYFNLLFQKL